MALSRKILVWCAPVILFPLFAFLGFGGLTDIKLIRRGVVVDGVITEVKFKEREISYEYGFEGTTYQHKFNYVGGNTNPTPTKYKITLDPYDPSVHVIHDPVESLNTNLKMTLIVFLGSLVMVGIVVAVGFKNPLDKFDKEAKNEWKKYKNDIRNR